MPGNDDIVIIVDESQAGRRLDIVSAAALSDCSRSLAAVLIKKGHIRVRNEIKKPGYRVRSGDPVRICLPPPDPPGFEPQAIAFGILYEDEYLIVVNKPPGLVVHPAPGHFSGTLVNGLLYHCPDLKGIGGRQRPGIVHRLDKDTSGVLVVAKSDPVHHHLSRQFKARQVQKTYLALVHGQVQPDTGSIFLSIGRHPVDRKKMSTVSRKARSAETRWTVKERFDDASLLELNLKTGRTHQIRVHCLAIRHPIVGDPVYSNRSARRKSPPIKPPISSTVRIKRQMLHAWRLRFVHPATRASIRFEAPLPDDMQQLLAALRSRRAERPSPGTKTPPSLFPAVE